MKTKFWLFVSGAILAGVIAFTLLKQEEIGVEKIEDRDEHERNLGIGA